ncbi:spermatogenesis-associated protein 24-like [Asterias rubens]|uniref:spermatogenesis-associated protein 24-like n=1 Tax=Asterias rubens TaxID=7604 RepID=UPI001455A87E|nr:spermatogenesis-associated protein 24-like [Asterias rubens]
MAGVTADILVHKQLQDLFLTQRRTLESWKRQMQSDQTETVTKEEHEQIIAELKEERQQHSETKARLVSESSKLQFALGEIEVLTKQLERERLNFEASFHQLKESTQKQSSQSSQLKMRYSAIETEKQKQDDILSLRDSKISDLKQRLAKQKDSYRQQVSELNVQLQQEAYIARTFTTRKPQRKSYTKPGK